MENYLSIYEIAKELNLKKGEVIYLASDITRLANIARNNNEQFNPKQFLETFTGVIGEKGTLLIPTFNYNLKKKSHFEILRTQPITGILAQYALKTPEFIRTYNALHSFAVWGKHAKDLSEIQNESSFSEESPFGFLFHKKGIMVAIDLDLQSSLTFTHYTEEQEKVNYRKWKKYTVNYTDTNNTTTKKTFKLYAKKPGYINNVNPLEDDLIKADAMIRKTINGINFLIIDLTKAHYVILEDIQKNKSKNIVHFNTTQWAKTVIKNIIGEK